MSNTPSSPNQSESSKYRQLMSHIKDLEKEMERYRLGWEPGHFYSPMPNLDEIRAHHDQVFSRWPPTLPGIDLNPTRQLHLLREFAGFHKQFPFGKTRKKPYRFFLDNPNYGPGESIILYAMLHHRKPARLIEIGCGYSSCLILDVNEFELQGAIDIDLVDPHPDLLKQLVGDQGLNRTRLSPKRVQDLDAAFFDRLDAGDFLIVDTSHVSKVGSDVNYIVLEVLPRLRAGVVIHFHDVFYPFEYPPDWIFQGRAWNEAYLLRAFLAGNHHFSIEFFNSYMHAFHQNELQHFFPEFAGNLGSSLWLKKTR